MLFSIFTYALSLKLLLLIILALEVIFTDMRKTLFANTMKIKKPYCKNIHIPEHLWQ